MVLYLRLCGYQSSNPPLALPLQALDYVVTSSLPGFVAIFLIVASACGLALWILVPNLHWSTDVFSAPFTIPFWGFLGDFDVQAMEDAVGDALPLTDPLPIMAPLLLYLYLVFATVVFVNLMIAQLSHDYEDIYANFPVTLSS